MPDTPIAPATPHPPVSEVESLRMRVAELEAFRLDRATEDELLRAIAEGTASVTGDDFFRALVTHLAQALEVRSAFVAEFTDVKTRVRTLAFWDNGAIVDNIEYDLAGTPCERVIEGDFCHYSDHVAELFPGDVVLKSEGFRAFMGVPLISVTGESLGHLAVFDTKPMPPEPRCLFVFKIFAARARAELERKWAQKALQESRERLAGILASTLDAIVTVDRDRRVSLFNAAAESSFGAKAEDVLGGPLDPFLTHSFRRVLDEALQTKPQKQKRAPQRYILSGENVSARRRNGHEFPIEGTVSHVRAANQDLFTIILRDIDDRRRAEQELRTLKDENVYLREEINAEYNFEEMVGRSPSFRKAVEDIRRVAPTDAAVLVMGETGTGKELAARAVHSLSARRERPLIKVNCVALSVGLVESELFGHEKGAFTGALTQRIGRFELANGGTIFLDEIGDISKEVQVKLLRVLQEKEFERVGGSKTIRTDVRVIAATNRDLARAVAEGQFREDLFFRLNVVPLRLPPLRERREDIPILVRYFVNKYMTRMGKRFDEIDPASMQRLLEYPWPGNARELEHLVERALILSVEPVLRIDEGMLPAVDAPPAADTAPAPASGSLEDVERAHILGTLEKTGWVIEGKKGAAVLLEMHPNTLRSRMQKLGISRKSHGIS